MFEARVQQHFFECADLLYQVAEGLAKPISDAAQAAVGCLTAGGKLLICGQGAGDGLARMMAVALMGRFERERPGLAALPLSGALASAVAAAGAVDSQGGLAQQVRSLGQPGDLLFAFCASADDPAVSAAVRDAHAKEMSIVLLGTAATGGLSEQLLETDVWIAVAHERPARVHEMHLLAMHALCDAIDVQLLGESDA